MLYDVCAAFPVPLDRRQNLKYSSYYLPDKPWFLLWWVRVCQLGIKGETMSPRPVRDGSILGIAWTLDGMLAQRHKSNNKLVFVDLFLGIWHVDAGGIFISMCVTLDGNSIMTFLIIYWIPFKLVQQQTVALSLNGGFLAAYSTNEQAKSERYNCIQYLASEYDRVTT